MGAMLILKSRIEFKWPATYLGIPGNEAANQAAKDAPILPRGRSISDLSYYYIEGLKSESICPQYLHLAGGRRDAL